MQTYERYIMQHTERFLIGNERKYGVAHFFKTNYSVVSSNARILMHERPKAYGKNSCRSIVVHTARLYRENTVSSLKLNFLTEF